MQDSSSLDLFKCDVYVVKELIRVVQIVARMKVYQTFTSVQLSNTYSYFHNYYKSHSVWEYISRQDCAIVAAFEHGGYNQVF